MDGICAERYRLDWNALVRGMNQLCKVPTLRQTHRQKAIGLNADLGEEPRIGDCRQQIGHRNAAVIVLAQNAGQRREETHVRRIARTWVWRIDGFELDIRPRKL